MCKTYRELYSLKDMTINKKDMLLNKIKMDEFDYFKGLGYT